MGNEEKWDWMETNLEHRAKCHMVTMTGKGQSICLAKKAERMCPTPPADGAQESHGAVDCEGMEVGEAWEPKARSLHAGSGSDSECAHCCRAKTTKTLLPEQEGRGRWGSRGH